MNWKNVKSYIIITFATAVCAVAVSLFLVPSHLAISSISGLAIVLSNVIPLPVSAITFIFNAVLLVVGFLMFGRDFGVKTVYTSLLLPVFMRGLEVAFPSGESIMGDPFQDMVCYVFIVSAGLALLFLENASSGGLDIVAKLLNKFFRMELGKAMTTAGLCVALSSAFVYDFKTVILSLLGTYVNGVILDHFIFGFDQKKRVCIITPKLEEVCGFIINDLHSGATLYEAEGAYDNTRRKEIITIVNKAEYSQLIKFLTKTDPTAFITVYAVSEVSYQPKPILPRQTKL